MIGVVNQVFLSLGSNLGDKKKYLESAIEFLRQSSHIELCKVSSWYETKALTLAGEEEKHPDFLNGVVAIKTNLKPFELLDFCKKMELECGRKQTDKRWQPRTLDIDILFYGDLILENEQLQIPHPSLHQRLFVLEPLKEIAPDFLHPILKKTMLELHEECKMGIKK